MKDELDRCDERDKAFEDFRKSTNDYIDNFIEAHNQAVKMNNERVDLLSRENAKLIEKNQLLKERLSNLGIKDFD